MSGRRKHIPQRTCVVCKQVASKRTLTRLVRQPDGRIQIDPGGKMPGRGAYICQNPDCWRTAAAGNVLERALGTVLTQEERAMIASRGTHLAPGAET
nr:YlxR family protein [Anaerolineae bacterium]